MKEANKELVKQCVDYIKDNYSFEDYLRKYNYLDSCKNTGMNSLAMSCPFHYDAEPSLIVNLDKQVYNCFACEHGGNLVGFIYSIEKEILGNAISYNGLVERLLKEDPAMQLKLGIRSIYRTSTTKITNLDKRDIRKRLSFHIEGERSIETFSELSNYLKTKSKDDILLSVDLMSRGYTPLEVFNQINNINRNKKFSGIDLGSYVNN